MYVTARPHLEHAWNTKDRLKQLKLPSLHYRRTRGDMIRVVQAHTWRISYRRKVHQIISIPKHIHSNWSKNA